MKKIVFLTPLISIIFYGTLSIAQVSGQNDGIQIQIIDGKKSVYYYGEPFWIYIEAINKKNVANNYFKPDHAINCRITLENVNTGDIIKTNNDYWNYDVAARARQNQKNGKGLNVMLYQPKDKYYSPINMLQYFGSVLLLDKPILSGSRLTYNLNAIPVGSYELILEYHLFPSDKVVMLRYPFKIIKLPQNEKQAFEEYIEATLYAIKSGFWDKKNYNENAATSYEKFLNKYPSSIFAQYALMDMVTEVYIYPVAPESVRKAKFQQYHNSFSKIKSTTLKMRYGLRLPKVLLLKNDNDIAKTKSELDKFLSKTADNYETSYVIIDHAKRLQNISGLKNYAKRQEDK